MKTAIKKAIGILGWRFTRVQSAWILVALLVSLLMLGAASIEQISVDPTTRKTSQEIHMTGNLWCDSGRIDLQTGSTLTSAMVSDATDSAGVGTLCKRSVHGDIAANFVGPLTGEVTGNAATATKLATARAIYGADFDGTAAIAGPVPIANGGTAAATAGAALTSLGITRGESGAMSSGVVVVKTTAVTANSVILLTANMPTYGLRPDSAVAVDSVTAGWGFEIVSGSLTDSATVNWLLLEP